MTGRSADIEGKMVELITSVKSSQYVFVIEAECDVNIVTRVHMIITRRV